MNRRLAVITARGGSKRIPRKNIRLFHGKPIIAYSIAAAIDSGCFETVMVSTDDAEIAEIARRLGAEVPFMRSAASSDDHATTAQVLQEVVEEWKKRGRIFDILCCLYPTAPFLTAGKLLAACSMMEESRASSLVSMVRFGYPLQRALRLVEGRIEFWMPEFKGARSQDLEPMYHDAGQMYWLRLDGPITNASIFSPHTVGFELPETEVQDIDTEADWEIAELKFSLMKGSAPLAAG